MIFKLAPLLLSVAGLLLEPPNNVVCFPDRDFCTFQGFLDFVGQEIRVEVTRNNVLIGAAIGIPSGDPATAFEINHPGGLCWGNKVDLQTTPDIKAGDRVASYYGDFLLGDMIIKDSIIADGAVVFDAPGIWRLDFKFWVNENAVNVGTKFVDITQVSARLTSGDFQDTPVGKRHVTAAFGVTTTNPAYTSTITADAVKGPGNYIVRFQFTDAASFKVAKGIIPDGFSVTISDFVDAAGNPIGSTSFEKGLVGGPWSALCPPLLVDAVGPTPQFATVFSKAASGNVPASYLAKLRPGKAATLINGLIEGYEFSFLTSAAKVEDVKETGIYILQGQTQSLFRTTGPPFGSIEVRSIIGPTLSKPLIQAPVTQSTVPVLALTQSAVGTLVKFKFTNFDPAYPIVYTLNGQNPISAGLPIGSSILYAAEETIELSVDTIINAAQFDGADYAFLTDTLKPDTSVKFPEDVNALTVTTEAINNNIVVKWKLNTVKPTFLNTASFYIEYYQVDEATGLPISGGTVSSATVQRNSAALPRPSGISGLPKFEFKIYSQSAAPNPIKSANPAIAQQKFGAIVDVPVITKAEFKAGQRFRVVATTSYQDINAPVNFKVYSTNADLTIGSVITQSDNVTPFTGDWTCDTVLKTCTGLLDAKVNLPATVTSLVYIISDTGGKAGPFGLK